MKDDEDNLDLYLRQALEDWLREHHEKKVRTSKDRLSDLILVIVAGILSMVFYETGHVIAGTLALVAVFVFVYSYYKA
jgi:hypothetical protein